MEPPADQKQLGRVAELNLLMVRYQQADLTAAGALIRQVSPLLFRFLTSDGASRHDAEDLLQEVWLRVHKARHTWRAAEPVLPWLYAIARHVKVDGYRKRQRINSRERSLESVWETPDPSVKPALQAFDFDTLVAALPQGQREVVRMLKVTGMSVEEVARATASTSGAVKVKAFRAYEKLRRILSPERLKNGIGGDR